MVGAVSRGAAFSPEVIEGLVDSSHLTVLHASGLARTNGVELEGLLADQPLEEHGDPLGVGGHPAGQASRRLRCATRPRKASS